MAEGAAAHLPRRALQERRGRDERARAGIVHACPYKYFIDGVAIPTPKDINGELPPQYAATGGGFCGVILFWTKDGSPASEP